MKLWGSVAMQDEFIGFRPFSIFFRVLQKPSSKIYFPVGTRSKTFLASTTTLGIQQMSKIQNRLAVKPKIIDSVCSNNQIMGDAPDFRVTYDLKVLSIFDHAYPANNY